MRFASVISDGRPLAVMIDGDRALPLRGVTELGRGTPSSMLREPPLDESGALPVEALELRPTIPSPGKVICVGLNYRAHVEETSAEEPSYPVFFTKFATSLAGANDELPLPAESASIDYEGELAVVIGERARRVPREQALQAVAGYTVADDVTVRDFQARSHQWLQGKAWDAMTPVGPWLVTADEVGDPQALGLRTTVNGELVQDASTAQMIFDVATLVSTLSLFATLEPGDLILTGTPSGVGFTREPPLLLGDGDVVAIEIDRVGRIENRFAAER
jgi:acylpyruvate hydrolase